jgi:hypothetical protein
MGSYPAPPCTLNFAAGFLAFAAVADAENLHVSTQSNIVEPALKVLSRPDGSWKVSLQEPPGEEWKSLSFDDAAWPALVQLAPPPMQENDQQNWRLQHCTEQGAICLGLPGLEKKETPVSWWSKLTGRPAQPKTPEQAVPTTGKVWVRKRFDVPAPTVP